MIYSLIQQLIMLDKERSFNNNEVNNVFHEAKKETDNSEDVGFKSGFTPSFNNSGKTPKNSEQCRKFITMCKEKIGEELPNNFNLWAMEEQYDHLISNAEKYFPNIPKSLRFVLPAIFEDGDCGRPMNEKPNWLNIDKFRHGQQFALRYFSTLCVSHLMGLLQIFSFTDGLKPLIISQKSNTPYRAFKRYLSIIIYFRNWYTSDPWCEGTQAYRDIQKVRSIHRSVRQKLCNADDEQIDQASEIQQMRCSALETIVKDFADTCPMMKSGQCPYTMTRMKGLNQGDMSGTQFACMGLMLLYSKQLGVYDATDEDLDAFCHFWRGIGYLLGIEDRYNFCDGDLQDIRQRAEDMIEHWVKPNFRTVTPEWEHMTFCLYNGVNGVFYLGSYKIHLLRLCDIIGLDMPRLYDSLSILEKIIYALQKFVNLYLVKLPGVFYVMNATLHAYLNRAANFGPKENSKIKKKLSIKLLKLKN